MSNLHIQVYFTLSSKNIVSPNTDIAKWEHETTIITSISTNQEAITYLKKNKKKHCYTSSSTGLMPTTCTLEARSQALCMSAALGSVWAWEFVSEQL